VQNTVIEPGWEGWLTLELTNHGTELLTLHEGTPIAQIVFQFLDLPTEQPYVGKYQSQEDRPVEAR
jgi:dCTP deaminase